MRTFKLSVENEGVWHLFLVLSDFAQPPDFPHEALGFLFDLYLPEAGVDEKQDVFEKILLLWKIDREIRNDADTKIPKKNKIQTD